MQPTKSSTKTVCNLYQNKNFTKNTLVCSKNSGGGSPSLETEFVSWPMVRYKREVLFGWVDLLGKEHYKTLQFYLPMSNLHCDQTLFGVTEKTTTSHYLTWLEYCKFNTKKAPI